MSNPKQGTNDSSKRPFWLNPFVIAPIVLLCGLVFGSCSGYSYYAGLQQEAVSKETALNAQYLSNQNYLSSYVSGFYEQIGVANLKSDRLNGILLDAVKGRYESSGGFSPNGAFFSAIRESYPDLTANTQIFDRIVDYIQAKREGYRGYQDKLLDMLRDYENWRQAGPVQSRIIRTLVGAPTDALVSRIGTTAKRGKEALDQMWLIVNTESVQKAYETGVMAPLTVPQPEKKPEPSATPSVTPQPSPRVQRKKR
jgi:hypothetical protein